MKNCPEYEKCLKEFGENLKETCRTALDITKR